MLLCDQSFLTLELESRSSDLTEIIFKKNTAVCLLTALTVHSGTPHQLVILASFTDPGMLLFRVVFFTTSKFKSDTQKNKLETLELKRGSTLYLTLEKPAHRAIGSKPTINFPAEVRRLCSSQRAGAF